MKKRLYIVVVSLLLCFLCGCLPTTPLTDEEMDVVAEYAASLLLKYDKKYNTPLYYAEEMEERLTPTPTPEPTPRFPTATPVPVPEQGNTSSGSSNTVVKATPTPQPVMYDEAETSRQITEIMAVEDVTVTCAGYELKKSVQSTEYFSLVAKEGRQYVVVKFLLHNTTNKNVQFDASENGLEYSLDINTGKVFRVSLSMLENDLQYMAIPVPANGTAEAVLVFEVVDTEINTMHLIMENELDDTVFVKLK